ncbi:uncharacterized protein LOC110453294 [Mizuhopecten yessoensis]|uniref:uncharacterized protein LOC110453294 n=1 Tax=Mizuhopecten yessoensis TaxID=6573 RepID=UPI000B45D0A6|nr:uncharacterized protein LOC110453294 [Mizuhopecten yessoensis]
MVLRKRTSMNTVISAVFGFVLCLLVQNLFYTVPTMVTPTCPTVDKADVDRITSGRSYTDPDFSDCQDNKHPGYIPRYPRRRCASNNTYTDFGGTMTAKQTARVNTCVLNFESDKKRELDLAIHDPSIRWSSHRYLNKSSFVIEAGGHNGLDVQELNSRYQPGTYVVLEPVKKFFHVLTKKFVSSPNVVVYNFGIDVSDGVFYMNDENNDAASIFDKEQNKNNTESRIVNATIFFEKMSVRKNDVDLITLNCEGCEYAVLDLLLSTDYIRHFRNIQFQPHNTQGICYSVQRYCWYQELLRKTHRLTFQYKFIWESWSRI